MTRDFLTCRELIHESTAWSAFYALVLFLWERSDRVVGVTQGI